MNFNNDWYLLKSLLGLVNQLVTQGGSGRGVLTVSMYSVSFSVNRSLNISSYLVKLSSVVFDGAAMAKSYNSFVRPVVISICTCTCMMESNIGDGLNFVVYQFSWFSWRVRSTNSRTHEMVTFYMNYERKHYMATNFEPHECIIFVQSTKIDTHKNKPIHSITRKLTKSERAQGPGWWFVTTPWPLTQKYTDVFDSPPSVKKVWCL